MTCPACGHEQVSAQPGVDCEKCHAGGGAKHVGKDFTRAGLAREAALAVAGNVGDPPVPSDLNNAFLEWIRPLRGKYDATTEALLAVAPTTAKRQIKVKAVF